jgi:agmatinase
MSAGRPYDEIERHQFGGTRPSDLTFDGAAALILPVPFERTTSYGTGTVHGPRELLLASEQVELWDEERGVDVYARGVWTLPEMDLSSATLDDAMATLRRVAADLLATGKFLITLGGEHSITSPLVAAAATAAPGLTILQVDAHADLRDSYLSERHSHACAMRRSLEFAPAVQVGIRNLSAEEAEALPSLPTTLFYDWNMREDPAWIDRVVDALDGPVYITIDVDGLDPGVMPAVGTPEPGGLSWRELTRLLRRTFERRHVVACDVVELCPIPGMIAPNFLAARLVYKLLTYALSARAPGNLTSRR